MNLLSELEQAQMKPAGQIPKFNVGDTVRVHFRIVEGEKERIQVFEGVVIGRKGGESPLACSYAGRTTRQLAEERDCMRREW